MRWRTLATLWNRFFFEPQSPAPLGLYRILFGLLVIAKLVLYYPDWLAWFGPHAWVTLDTMHRMEGGIRINVFDLLPESDAWIWGLFAVTLLAAICLTVGFLTRLSSVLVFFTLVSLDERELYAINSGDTFLRVVAFFLMFAPAGAAFSVDRLIAIWRGEEPPTLQPQIVWPQRMIQFQAALVYFITAWWKSTGATWVDGTALYYVHHLAQFHRFPLPAWFLNPIVVKLQTWIGLTEEFALGTLIWIRDVRYWVLGAGVLLHLTLEYSMNVPLFQWIMLSTFVLFIDPEDLSLSWNWLSQRIAPRLGPRVEVLYNEAEFQVRRRIYLLRALDVFRKIDFVSQREGKWNVSLSGFNLTGRAAGRALTRVIPLLWPFHAVFVGKPSKNSAT